MELGCKVALMFLQFGSTLMAPLGQCRVRRCRGALSSLWEACFHWELFPITLPGSGFSAALKSRKRITGWITNKPLHKMESQQCGSLGLVVSLAIVNIFLYLPLKRGNKTERASSGNKNHAFSVSNLEHVHGYICAFVDVSIHLQICTHITHTCKHTYRH